MNPMTTRSLAGLLWRSPSCRGVRRRERIAVLTTTSGAGGDDNAGGSHRRRRFERQHRRQLHRRRTAAAQPWQGRELQQHDGRQHQRHGPADHPRRPRCLPDVGSSSVSAHRHARVHAQHLRSQRRQRGRRRQPLPATRTADDRNVTLDVEGPGVLYFVRTNHWHGSPWHYVVDGTDHVVAGDAAPPIPTTRCADRCSCRPSLFPSPLAVDLVDDQGRRPQLGADPLRRSRCAWPTGARTTAPATTSTTCSSPARPPVAAARVAGTASTPPGARRARPVRRAGTDIAPDRSRTVTAGRESRRDRRDRRRRQCIAGLKTGACAVFALWCCARPRRRRSALAHARAAHHLGRRGAAVDRRPGRALLRRGHALQPRQSSEYLVKGLSPIRVHFDAFERVSARAATSRCRSSAARTSSSSPAERDPRSSLARAHRAVHGADRPRRLLPRHLRRSRRRRSPGKDLVAARHHQGRRRRAVVRAASSGCRSSSRTTRELGTLEGDPRFFFDDSRDAAGAGHGHRRVGRRRRLLGRPDHDAAVRGSPRRARRSAARRKQPRTRSSPPTASCSPT